MGSPTCDGNRTEVQRRGGFHSVRPHTIARLWEMSRESFGRTLSRTPAYPNLACIGKKHGRSHQEVPRRRHGRPFPLSVHAESGSATWTDKLSTGYRSPEATRVALTLYASEPAKWFQEVRPV